MKQRNRLRTPRGASRTRAKGSGRGAAGSPHPVDIYVGSRVRLRRTLMGLSQGKLGEAVGLTFQQIQKYERGSNRIGASRIKEFSEILDVPVSFFFDGADNESPATLQDRQSRKGAAQKTTYDDPLHKKETLELVRAYYRISDPLVRKRIFEMVKALAKSEGAAS